jgi:hypothetical protein
MAEILQFPSRKARLCVTAPTGRGTNNSAAERHASTQARKSAMPANRALGRLLMSTAIRISANAPTSRF